MPTYEYQCLTCAKIKEIEQRITDDPYEGLSCNHCGGSLNRVISLSSFKLAGGGWAKDGYSKTGSNDARDSAEI